MEQCSLRRPPSRQRPWRRPELILPVIQLGGVQANRRGGKLRVQALLALRRVVVRATDGDATEDHDDRQVDERHEAHEDVTQAPRDLELQQRTAEDQGSCHEAEGRQHPLFQLDVAQQEAEVDFGVVEIAHQRREREQEECQRNEDLRDRLAEHCGHRVLHEGSAGDAAVVTDTRGEDHERGEGTNDHRVDEDREHLNEALLGRVRHGGGGCGVRRGTHTGLVRVEATLDAEHHAEPAKPPKIALKSKAPEKIAENIAGILW